MGQTNPVTIRPPKPRIVQVCAISADVDFLTALGDYLAKHCEGSAKLVAAYVSIPKPDQDRPHVDVVVFDPKNPDFVRIDGIDRVQVLFGEEVKLIALLPHGITEEECENLEASGVSTGVQANDFVSIASHLNQIALAGDPEREARASGTSVTPLRPEMMAVHICIIAEDREFAQRLKLVLKRDLGEMALIEGDFDHIPSLEELGAIFDMQLVIFDPEMDEFRNLGAGLDQLRTTAGSGALYVARTDHWKDANNRLTKKLKELGVKAGCSREDYVGFAKLAGKLRDGLPADFITI